MLSTYGNAPASTTVQALSDRATVLQFDGIDDRVIVPYDASFPTEVFTAGAWIKLPQPAGRAAIIARGEDDNSFNLSWQLYVTGDGTLEIMLEDSRENNYCYPLNNCFEGGTCTVTGDLFVADDEWHHVAATRNSSADLDLYIDGERRASCEGTGVPSSNNFHDLSIGCTFGTIGPPLGGVEPPVWFFPGQIDEPAMWEVALAAADVADIVSGGVDPLSSGLVGLWAFDEGAGQNVADLSPAQNHGFLGEISDPDGTDPLWVESESVGGVEASLGAPLIPGLCVSEVVILNIDTATAVVDRTIQRGGGQPQLTESWREIPGRTAIVIDDAAELPGLGAPGSILFDATQRIAVSPTYTRGCTSSVDPLSTGPTSQGPHLHGARNLESPSFFVSDVDGVPQGGGTDSTFFIYNGADISQDYRLLHHSGAGQVGGSSRGSVGEARLAQRRLTNFAWTDLTKENNRLRAEALDDGRHDAFVSTQYDGSNDVAFHLFRPTNELGDERIHAPIVGRAQIGQTVFTVRNDSADSTRVRARLTPTSGAAISSTFDLEGLELRAGTIGDFWPEVGADADFTGAASFDADNAILVHTDYRSEFLETAGRVANTINEMFHAPLPPFVAADGAAKRAVVLGARPSETSQWTFAAYNTGTKQMRIRVIFRRADGTAIFERIRTVGARRLELVQLTAAAVGTGIWADVRVLTPTTSDRRVLPFFIELKDTGELNIYNGQVVS